MTKTERWLNLIAFLLDHRFPVTREEILSQVSDYKEDWNPGDDAARIHPPQVRARQERAARPGRDARDAQSHPAPRGPGGRGLPPETQRLLPPLSLGVQRQRSALRSRGPSLL